MKHVPNLRLNSRNTQSVTDSCPQDDRYVARDSARQKPFSFTALFARPVFALYSICFILRLFIQLYCCLLQLFLPPGHV